MWERVDIGGVRAIRRTLPAKPRHFGEPVRTATPVRQASRSTPRRAALDDASARSYRDAYLKYAFRQQMWDANYRRLRKSDPDLFALVD